MVMDRSLGFVLPRGLAIVGDDDDDGRVSGLALCLLCFSFHFFFCPVLPVLDKTRTNRFQYTIQGLTVCKYFFRSKNAILELETRKPPPICHGLCGDQIRQKKKKVALVVILALHVLQWKLHKLQLLQP